MVAPGSKGRVLLAYSGGLGQYLQSLSKLVTSDPFPGGDQPVC